MAHHHLSDVFAIQIAKRDAPVMRLRAVQLASELPAEHERAHRFSCLGTTRLVTLGCCEALKPDRHAAELDGVAIPDVGYLALDDRHDAARPRLGFERPGGQHRKRHKHGPPDGG